MPSGCKGIFGDVGSMEWWRNPHSRLLETLCSVCLLIGTSLISTSCPSLSF